MRHWRLWWVRIRDSLWFVPSLITLGCVALAFVLVQVEQAELLPWTREAPWLFTGGADGARGVLGAIAGGLITVTGVAFSVTIVALQLASSQYSPRVLHGFISDRYNQVVLGVLIGTFSYALLVMRTIRSEADDRVRFVPSLAVTVGIALLLVSVVALIAFINHSARSLRIEVIVERQASRTRAQIDRLFPSQVGEADHAPGRHPELPLASPAPVSANGGGYVQAIDGSMLFELAERRSMTIVMEILVGQFVLPGEVVARVWPADALDEVVGDHVRAALALGHERTYHQDLEFGLVGLADIALRALSPGINDPTTARLVADRLAELLVYLSRRAWPSPVRTAHDGSVRVVTRRLDFARAVEVSYSQLRHAAASHPMVVLHLLDTLRRMGPLVPPEFRTVLAHEVDAVAAAAGEVLTLPADRAAMIRARDAAQAWLGEPQPPARPHVVG